ncbi:MAG: hypothetical protein V2A77_06760 [Pseudomonadota bacterium]
MSGFQRPGSLLLLLLLCASLGLEGACARPRSRWLGLDTAQYHLETGLKLLAADKPAHAERELALAIYYDPRCGLAYCGLCVACAQEGKFDEARGHLNMARRLAGDGPTKCQVQVAHLRLLLAERPAGWLDSARETYAQAQASRAQNNSQDAADQSPAYFMALCYKAALELERAEELLARVVAAGGTYSREAAQEWRLVERARRCPAQPLLGRELTTRSSLSRAELAALLRTELGLGEPWPTGRPEPEDLAAHKMKGQVLPILMLNLEPLVVFADGTFHPDTPITRVEFARLLQSLLEGWNAGRMNWREPARSPYPDVLPETTGYDAITLCGSRGLLEVRDLLTGEMEPGGLLAGADALLAIGRLREQRGAR